MRPRHAATNGRPWAGAFTLVELMVVLVILGLIIGLVSMGAPRMFDRGELRAASSRLEGDLYGLARQARDDGVNGEIVSVDGGRGYRIVAGAETLAERRLAHGGHVTLTPDPIGVDAAGRASGGVLTLTFARETDVFDANPLTGTFAARRSGHGAR